MRHLAGHCQAIPEDRQLDPRPRRGPGGRGAFSDNGPRTGCRLCLVSVEGMNNPTASCGLACQDGMVVETENENLIASRKDIIDLFVSDHPLNTLYCRVTKTKLLT